MPITTINSMSVKAQRRLWCVVLIGRAPRLNSDAAKCEFNPPDAVIFEKHLRMAFEFARVGDIQLDAKIQRLARVNLYWLALLRTEAAILPAAPWETENSRWPV
jgi:hypothetical protein